MTTAGTSGRLVRSRRGIGRAVSRARDEEGSVLLLALGYAVLALVLVLVCVDATSLYLAQKRTDTIADAAALAGSDGFVITTGSGGISVGLQTEAVRDLALSVVSATPGATIVQAGSPDGVSARVTVSTLWHPPVATLFVPEGVRLEATATSRTVLR